MRQLIFALLVLFSISVTAVTGAAIEKPVSIIEVLSQGVSRADKAQGMAEAVGVNNRSSYRRAVSTRATLINNYKKAVFNAKYFNSRKESILREKLERSIEIQKQRDNSIIVNKMSFLEKQLKTKQALRSATTGKRLLCPVVLTDRKDAKIKKSNNWKAANKGNIAAQKSFQQHHDSLKKEAAIASKEKHQIEVKRIAANKEELYNSYKRRNQLKKDFFKMVHSDFFALSNLNKSTIQMLAQKYEMPEALAFSFAKKFNISFKNHCALMSQYKTLVAVEAA